MRGLTVLGVVIGIAAVTTMVSVGQSAGELVQGQFQALGTNVLIVFPGSERRGGVRQSGNPSLTAADADAIGDECPSVLAASPFVWTTGQVIYGNVNWNPDEMLGVGSDYLTVRNWQLRSGDFFTAREISAAEKVCVIGQTLVVKLFQTTNPIGQTIRVKNIPFRVIGVLDSKGANLVGAGSGQYPLDALHHRAQTAARLKLQFGRRDLRLRPPHRPDVASSL